MNHVLVLGGNGFLGGQVARWLASHGHRVRVFDLHLPHRPPAQEASCLEFVEGNFLNPADLDAALAGGIDLVLHFISTTVPASSIGNVPVEIETNVAGTVRLLDLMARRGIASIAFPSSGGTVYGESDQPHREEEQLSPTCPYGLGKMLIEGLLGFYRKHHGIEFRIFRIANPYGDPGKLHTSQGVIDAFLHRVRAGQPLSIWGDGSAVRDFIFCDDVATAIGTLLQSGAPKYGQEIVNIGSGRGASIAEVVEIIRGVVDQPVVVTQLAGYQGPSSAVLDVTKLHALTGWKPRYDLKDGIREAWRRLLG